jgi:hypothetical protein
MIIAWKNQIENYSLSSDQFDDDIYLLENLKDPRLDKYTKGNDFDATQDIVIDCGAAVEPGVIAIFGHNFTSFAAPVIKILANTINDFSSPAYSYTFDSISDIMFHVYDGATYQYFCIRIEGCTATDIPIIGYLFMDDSSFLSNGFNLSKIHPIEYVDNSISEKSIGGALFGYENSFVPRRFKLVYDYMTGDNFVLYREFMRYVQKSKPYIIIWDETIENPGLENIFCNNISGLSNSALFGFKAFSVEHEIEETR